MQNLEPPFGLGETLSGTDSDSNLINDAWLGVVHVFPAENLPIPRTRGNKARLTGKNITAVCLRNVSGAALNAKHVVSIVNTAGYGGMETAGYSITLAQPRSGVVDEFLQSAGVADDDLFWCIIGGPVKVLMPLTGAQLNGTQISLGDGLVSATVNSTTGALTSGRIAIANAGQAATGGSSKAATLAYAMAAGLIGFALSARTSGETTEATDVLIDCVVRN